MDTTVAVDNDQGRQVFVVEMNGIILYDGSWLDGRFKITFLDEEDARKCAEDLGGAISIFAGRDKTA